MDGFRALFGWFLKIKKEFLLKRKKGAKIWARKNFQRKAGLLLFLSGLAIFLFIPFYKAIVNPELPQMAPSPTPSVSVATGEIFDHGPIKIGENLLHPGPVSPQDLPEKIIIPSIAMDIGIKPAKVVGGTWEIFDETASFGLGSAPPGQKGNTVIFAHAKRGLFAPLRNIKKDAPIYILTPVGWYSYQVTEIKTVSPKQVEVLLPTEEETLTLYTCSGFADTKRLVVHAKRITAEPL